MKRIISFVLLIMFGTVQLTGCVANQEQKIFDPYEVLICGYSDSISDVHHEIEYEFANREKYDSIQPRGTLELTLNNEKVLVELVASSTDSAEYREENYFPEYKYEDSAGSEYMFDNEELLTYYWNSNITKEGNSVSEKECVDIAEKFAQQIFNTSEYSRSVELEEWHGEKRYKVLYVKYIGGIETTDYAGIYINLNGEIIYYSAFMLNRIPLETDINSVDLDAATEAVKQRLDAMYENVKENYDRIEYSEPDFKLTVLKNGQKGLVTNVSVHCIEDLGAGFESRIGEELNIVVPLP